MVWTEAVAGLNDAITQVNCCDDEVTFIDLLPAGVCAEFESRMNDHARESSITFRIVVFAPAVIVSHDIQALAAISQQLFATVVTD